MQNKLSPANSTLILTPDKDNIDRIEKVIQELLCNERKDKKFSGLF